MIKNWVKDRLTKEKQGSELWSGFANILQAMFEEAVEPILERITNRKSFYTMNKSDLALRMAEYGRFFNVGETADTSRPILLSQRLDEVHFKGTDKPIISTFWREFENLPVTLQAQYAPIDQELAPYGTFFTSKEGIAIAKEKYGEFFLTSRVQISVSLNELYMRYGYQEQSETVNTLLTEFDRIIAPLLPLHTVFDGVALFLSFDLTADASTATLASAGIDYQARMTFADLQSEFRGLQMATQQQYDLPVVALQQVKRCERYDMFAADAWWNDYRSRPDARPDPITVASAGRDNRARLFTVNDINYIGIQKGNSQGVRAAYTDGTEAVMEFPHDGSPEYVLALPDDGSGSSKIATLFFEQFVA